MARVDVTIFGAGIFGLSIAWFCLKHGARVRVIDPDGVGAGASGGIVGALAPHVPENWNAKKAFQFESLLMAESFWTEIEEISGQNPGYMRKGRLQLIADHAMLELAQKRAETSLDLWQGRAEWRVISDVDNPWGVRSPSGKMILDTLSAQLHPRKATQALARAIRNLGGEIDGEGPAQGAIVYATGVADLVRISHQMGTVVGNGVKGQAALFQMSLPNAPQGFFDTLHFIAHPDGTLAVGSTSERDYDAARETDDKLDELIEKARQILPPLHKAVVIERWAGLRPRSRSRAPLLGAHPLDPGAFIANGGFKIGFGMAPKVGQVMSKLILEGRDVIPDAFRSN